jgi:hypothetical protein
MIHIIKHYFHQHTLGSRMNSILPTVSSSWSLTRTVNGRRFSLKAWKPRWSWSPDFMTGMRFPANSMYWGFPSSTCKTDSSHSSDNRWVAKKQYKRLVGVLVLKYYEEKCQNKIIFFVNVASNICATALVRSYKTWRHVYNLAVRQIHTIYLQWSITFMVQLESMWTLKELKYCSFSILTKKNVSYKICTHIKDLKLSLQIKQIIS